MYNFHFLLVRFAALRHYDIISGIRRCFLNSAQYAGKEVVYQLGDNDADGIAAACAEIYGKYVGLVVMLARIGMDKVTCFLADVRIVFQRPRHSGGGDIQRPGNILDGNLRFIHGIVLRTKIR